MHVGLFFVTFHDPYSSGNRDMSILGIGGDSTPKVQPNPAPPSRSDAEIQEAALLERRRRAAAFGRQDTIKTGGQGVTDGVKTNVKVLLGE